jgi:hypothetical protein
MVRKVITEEQWKFARAQWEAEPLMSHAQVGSSLGISKQAVQKKAKEQSWQKRISIKEITDDAYAAADSLSDAKADESGEKPGGASPLPPVVVAGVPVNQPGRTDPLSDFERSQLAKESALKKRVEILDRHRTEVNGPRKMAYEALTKKDFNLAKIAKSTAEALKLTQDAERRAWGFDRDEKPGTVVVIERGGRRGA